MTDSDVQDPVAQPDPPAPTSETGAPAAKADLGKRIVAVLIDSAIAFVIGFIPGIMKEWRTSSSLSSTTSTSWQGSTRRTRGSKPKVSPARANLWPALISIR